MLIDKHFDVSIIVFHSNKSEESQKVKRFAADLKEYRKPESYGPLILLFVEGCTTEDVVLQSEDGRAIAKELDAEFYAVKEGSHEDLVQFMNFVDTIHTKGGSKKS